MASIESLAYIALVFALAGWVKGVVGLGLPTVAMGALGLVLPPVEAAALLVVPSLVTNLWQFLAGRRRLVIARRLAGMMVFVCIGTAVGISFLTSGSSQGPSIALGAVLAGYALLSLFLPPFVVAPRAESALAPVVGGITGLLTGATGIFAVPAVPYLSALGFRKDELVQALGLSFTVSTVALGVALGASGRYAGSTALVSLVAVLPALLGMLLGQRTRDRIEPRAFRRWFYIAMLLVGVFMMARGVAPF